MKSFSKSILFIMAIMAMFTVFESCSQDQAIEDPIEAEQQLTLDKSVQEFIQEMSDEEKVVYFTIMEQDGLNGRFSTFYCHNTAIGNASNYVEGMGYSIWQTAEDGTLYRVGYVQTQFEAYQHCYPPIRNQSGPDIRPIELSEKIGSCGSPHLDPCESHIPWTPGSGTDCYREVNFTGGSIPVLCCEARHHECEYT